MGSGVEFSQPLIRLIIAFNPIAPVMQSFIHWFESHEDVLGLIYIVLVLPAWSRMVVITHWMTTILDQARRTKEPKIKKALLVSSQHAQHGACILYLVQQTSHLASV